MAYYHSKETWKVVYYPKELHAGRMGVALVEACDRHDAMYTFSQEYAGEYSTVASCEPLFD